MRERAQSVGALIEINSKINSGTTIQLSWDVILQEENAFG